MISKLTATDLLSLRIWAQQAQSEFNRYIQVLEAPVSKSGIISNYVHGKHPSKQLTAGNSAYFGFIVPHSLVEFREAGIRIIPTTNGTISYTINLSYGGVGEDENAKTKTASVSGRAVIDDQITELDLPIVTFFTDQKTGDQVGCELVLDSATTTTDIQVLSLYIKYI